VIGNLSQKVIDKCIFMRDRRDKDDPMVKRSRDGKRRLDEEGLLIETICSYMKENNVRVNSITRELIGMDYDVFMYNLEKELNISSIYSLSAIDKVVYDKERLLLCSSNVDSGHGRYRVL